ELACILALIAARHLPAEGQLAGPLPDARPGCMVGRTVEIAPGKTARAVEVDLGIAKAVARAHIEAAGALRERRTGIERIDIGDIVAAGDKAADAAAVGARARRERPAFKVEP